MVMVFFKGLHRWLPNHPKRQGGRKGEGAPYPLTRSRGGGDALRSLRHLIYRDQLE